MCRCSHVYLALTIAAMTGVSRMRRWPWLALAALAGGAGWSLWMIFIVGALDVVGSLSIGAYVLLLGVAIPLFAYEGPRATLLRAAASIVGALQLALLVAHAGFTSAALGTVRADREPPGNGSPGASAALPSSDHESCAVDPADGAVARPRRHSGSTLIGIALMLIHAGPLLARLWSQPSHLRRTLELCLLALVIAPLAKWHIFSLSDGALALIALGARCASRGRYRARMARRGAHGR
jgi:hypothetical protein